MMNERRGDAYLFCPVQRSLELVPGVKDKEDGVAVSARLCCRGKSNLDTPSPLPLPCPCGVLAAILRTHS